MTSSPNQDEMGVEVQMPPSYWDKWVPRWDGDLTDNAPDAASSTADDDTASSGNGTSSRMSNKKKALLALSFTAVSTGGTVFALNGKKNITKAVDFSRVHKVDTELCEDVRRVLVVPGSEEVQPMIETSNMARYMRILNLKGSSSVARRTKCVRDGDDDKCATKQKKKKTKNADRKLGQQLGSQPSSSLTTRSPAPTLCRDDSEEDTFPEQPRVEPLPVTESPTASPRRTSAPTKDIATETEVTPAPSDTVEKEENEPTTPGPTSSPTNQPTKATPDPTSSPTNQPTKVTPSPTPKVTEQDNDPNDSTETGFLGYDLVKNDNLKLRVNAGLEIKLIAKKNQKVEFSNGKNSDIPYHEWMDGAGVIPLKDGYVYVSNSENDDGLGGVWGMYFNEKDEIVDFKKLLGGTTWNCVSRSKY